GTGPHRDLLAVDRSIEEERGGSAAGPGATVAHAITRDDVERLVAGPPPHRRGAAPPGSVTSRSAQRPSCPPHPRATGSRAPRAPATTPTTRGRPRPPRGAPPRPRRAPFAPPRELPAAPGAAPSNPPAISAT